MTQVLINGLRTATDWIENGTKKYDWVSVPTCQCGILTQAITSLDATDIQEVFPSHIIWRDVYGYTEACSINKPISYIIKTLLDAGMHKNDFYNLENLVDRKTGIKNIKQYDPKEAVKYMRDWADELERELLFFSLNQPIKPNSILVNSVN
jgi:hypothetical protein